MAKTPVGVPPGTAADLDATPMNGKGQIATAIATTEAIETLLHNRSRDELMQLLSPERKALYERIQALRKAIGKSPVDIAESLRELREHA